MDTRVLGGSGIEVSPVGLGCMGFSHAYGAPTDHDEAVATIRRAFDMGYTFFDTAEVYVGTYADGTPSVNERLVGEALRDVRDQVVIATKCGIRIRPDRSLEPDGSPAAIRRSVESSLRNLGVETIDLYYQHRIDPKVEPETVAETMAALMREGKIRAWGVSEADEAYLRRAHAVCPVAAVQNRYSMMARWHEDLFPVLEELGVAFVAFSPMANGMLSGAYAADTAFGAADYRADMPQYTAEGFERARNLLAMLRRTADAHGATPAQVSLAWMLRRKPYIIPIPGSRRPKRLEENLRAAQVALTADEIAAIDDALDHMDLQVFGGHYGR